MSFFGDLLRIIAIGAFFVATGTIGGLAAGALRTVIGLGGVVANYLGNLIDRPQLVQDRQNQIVKMALDPGTALPVIYGRAKVGAIVTDWFIDPADNMKRLYIVTAWCHGSRD